MSSQFFFYCEPDKSKFGLTIYKNVNVLNNKSIVTCNVLLSSRTCVNLATNVVNL